jgi:hypothetical protein
MRAVNNNYKENRIAFIDNGIFRKFRPARTVRRPARTASRHSRMPGRARAPAAYADALADMLCAWLERLTAGQTTA